MSGVRCVQAWGHRGTDSMSASRLSFYGYRHRTMDAWAAIVRTLPEMPGPKAAMGANGQRKTKVAVRAGETRLRRGGPSDRHTSHKLIKAFY